MLIFCFFDELNEWQKIAFIQFMNLVQVLFTFCVLCVANWNTSVTKKHESFDNSASTHHHCFALCVSLAPNTTIRMCSHFRFMNSYHFCLYGFFNFIFERKQLILLWSMKWCKKRHIYFNLQTKHVSQTTTTTSIVMILLFKFIFIFIAIFILILHYIIICHM